MLQSAAHSLLSLPRFVKRAVALAFDAALCALSVWLAFYLRLDEWVPLNGSGHWAAHWALLGSLLLALPIFIVSGLYRATLKTGSF